MHPADIRAALAKKGYTQDKLLEGTPYGHQSFVSHIIHGRRFNATIHQKISDVTGIPLHKLWPRIYNRNGQRKQAA